MKNKKTLSDDIVDDLRGGDQLGLRIEDVKEFIEDIKEISKGFIAATYRARVSNFDRFCMEINKRAGSKLT